VTDVITQYTIYYDPADAPGRFVAREWRIVRGLAEPQLGQAWIADTLEAARSIVPEDLVMIPRDPDDDETIVETWT
jgi:hypothetical protein